VFVRLFALLALIASCAPDPTEYGPVEALGTFLAAIDRSAQAPEQRKVAYEWLDAASQAALKERAELSASLVGRAFEPWEMLVPGRLGFSLRSIGNVRMSADVSGDRATVRIPVHDREPVLVPLVRETGRWRVQLGLKPATSE
jgi:hypothetical protein